MEDLMANTRLHIEELQSTITILQKAAANEFETFAKEDLDNYLEIVSKKMKTVLKEYDKLVDNLEKHK